MSSYSGTAPLGDPKATGAYAVAIAAQAGVTNNAGHATDSAGNLAVDYVWGGVNPLQPNDERRASISNTGGSTYDVQWSATTQVASTNLAYGDVAVTVGNNPTRTVNMDNHVRAEAGWASYPRFASTHQAVYRITQASGDGTTQTYTAPNNLLKAGDTVNIAGTGLDGTNLTVASANQYTFTVTASGTGSYINISGTARYTDEVTSNDGAYVSGVAYVVVPNVVGLSTASATDAMNDAELVPTTASAVTPAISNVALTSNVVTITTAAAHGYAAGDSATVAAVTNTAVNGTFTLLTASGTTLTYALTHGNIGSGADTGTVKVAARAGTIKTQSVAAGASSISAGTAVTITPYFAS
jgi:hypothetical protein